MVGHSIKGIWIGTSGWTYNGWRGPFYPMKLAKKDWLGWYGTQFSSAEVNGSFYRTPCLEAVRGWRNQTPADFIFAWKASKFITHWKRLNENTCGNSIDLMTTRLKALGQKPGPVLFQLPGNFKGIATGWHDFCACFRTGIATHSNSGMRAGTKNQCSMCYGIMMWHCVWPIIIWRRRLGF